MNLYEKINHDLLNDLDQGLIPWQLPWMMPQGGQRNMLSGKEYQGVNIFLTGYSAYKNKFKSPYWATIKQINDLGGSVKSGSKSTPIIFFKMIEKQNKESDEIDCFSLFSWSLVFNFEQCWFPENIKEKFNQNLKQIDFNPILQAESFAREYLKKENISLKEGTTAYYSSSKDEIILPAPDSFKSCEEYYSTFFHEMIHSTGTKQRLNRATMQNLEYSTCHGRSQEELVAEIGACYLRAQIGIKSDFSDKNSIAYIQEWKKNLLDNPKWFINSASQAFKAVEFINSKQSIVVAA